MFPPGNPGVVRHPSAFGCRVWVPVARFLVLTIRRGLKWTGTRSSHVPRPLVPELVTGDAPELAIHRVEQAVHRIRIAFANLKEKIGDLLAWIAGELGGCHETRWKEGSGGASPPGSKMRFRTGSRKRRRGGGQPALAMTLRSQTYRRTAIPPLYLPPQYLPPHYLPPFLTEISLPSLSRYHSLQPRVPPRPGQTPLRSRMWSC